MDSCHLIIGKGLVGGELASHLVNIDAVVSHVSGIPWNEPTVGLVRFSQLVKGFLAHARDRDWTIHWCAGVSVPRSSSKDLAIENSYFERLLLLLSEHCVTQEFSRGRLVFLSSIGGLFDGATLVPLSEASNPLPLSPYGKMKLRHEEELVRLGRSLNLSVLLARLSNVYGRRQNLRKRQGLISQIARASLTRTPLTIFAPLTTVRNFVSAGDAARLITAHLSSQTESVRVANICSGEDASIARVIRLAEMVTKRRIPIQMSSPASQLASSSDLRVVTRYQQLANVHARTRLEAGLSEVFHSLIRDFQMHGQAAVSGV